MKVAIIQSGAKPDMPFDRAGFGLVIVVDQAAAHFAGDWWVVSLNHIDVKPKGEPGIFGNAEIAAHLGLEKPPEKVKAYEPLWKDHPASLGWSLYPTAAAIVLAKSLGATEVKLLGGSTTDGREAGCLLCEKQVLEKTLAEFGWLESATANPVAATVKAPPLPASPPPAIAKVG